MKSVLIVHGTRGSPKENWFPWLKAELEKIDCEVFVPQFPTPKNQSLENWKKVFEEYESRLDENSIFVGHSLGVPFLLSILENVKAKACFFVAGFTGPLGIDYDELNKDIIEREFSWNKIKENCKKFYLFQSDNDPYVSLTRGEELAKDLGMENILVKNAGHFNAKAGYTEFPLLLNKIKNELNRN
tara:strand:+ start:666 stop:1223 length:558 start_codon:yes stop_codon:yes gene_type:complete